MFANFNKSHYLELLKPKKRTPKYIRLHTAVSFYLKKKNVITTHPSFKFMYCLVIDLID